MKKITYICLALLFTNQNIQAQCTFNKETVTNISCHIEDWNVWTNDLYLKTNFNDTIECLPYCIVTNAQNDTIYDIDMNYLPSNLFLAPGDSLGIEYFINIGYGRFWESLGDDFEFNSTWPHGQFTVTTYLINPSDSSIIGQDSSTFTISESGKPALDFPHHNNVIDDSLASFGIFSWTRPQVSASELYYKFYLVELDSLSIIDGVDEYDILNRPNLAGNLVVNNQESLPLSNFNFTLNSNYAWAVQSFSDTQCTQEIGANHGMAYANRFSMGIQRRGDNPTAVLTCSNVAGGFEDQSIDFWEEWLGFRSQNSIEWRQIKNSIEYSFTNSTDPADNNGVDPVPVGGGNHSLQIGKINTHNGTVDRLDLSFIVTPEVANLVMNLATEMQHDGMHDEDDQPFVQAKITRRRTKRKLLFWRKTVTHTLFNYRSTAGYDPYLEEGASSEYTNWDCFNINLNNYIGEKITLSLLASDCSFTGHGSKLLVDFCATNTPVFVMEIPQKICFGDDIIANASSTKNLTSWQWTFEECDINGNRFGNEQITPWYYGESPKTFNLTSFLALNKYEVKCNSYYRVKIGGSNRCSDWSDYTVIIQVICPALDAAGPDRCSPNWSQNVPLGANPISGYNYSWSPSICLSNSSISNPTFTPGICTFGSDFIEYTVDVTDPQSGCSGQDMVTIYSKAPQNLAINVSQGVDLCLYKLTLTGNPLAGDIVWTTSGGLIVGEGNPIVFNPREFNITTIATITATASNPCGIASESVNINDIPYFGDIKNDLTIIFRPSLLYKYYAKNPQLQTFTIYEFDVNKPIGYQPSYGATKYKLWMKARWGEIFMVDEGTLGNFENGEISWDGKINGKRLPTGLYHWNLELWNCRRNEPYSGFLAKNAEEVCLKRVWKFLYGWDCSKWTYKDKIIAPFTGECEIVN